jgi:hypothetical protein
MGGPISSLPGDPEFDVSAPRRLLDDRHLVVVKGSGENRRLSMVSLSFEAR